MSNQPEIIEIDTHFIRTDGGTQTRASLNAFTLDEYYQAMERGAQFPPIDVYYDGAEYWLADGFHRLAAVEKMQNEAIECRVHQGDKRAAILHSVGANAQHGLQRSRDDVNRAIAMMLRDSEWQKWTDSAIGAKVGCSNKTVAARRTEMIAAGEIEPVTVRVAVDGRLMDTRKIGEGAQETPTASMLEPKPPIHASMPNSTVASSLVQLSPAPAPRVENHPILIPAAQPIAPKPEQKLGHWPTALPTLTPAAPPPLNTAGLPTLVATAGPPPLNHLGLPLIPVAAPVAPVSHDLQVVIHAQAIASLLEAMAKEAQRLAHEAYKTYEQTTKNYIDIEVDASKFDHAATLLMDSPFIQSQAAYLTAAVTIENT